MAAENNLHQGHRERMRERIAQQGFESLADHEALEVLLYLTNPRKNTNVMAHALLKRFGSFSRVLDADCLLYTSPSPRDGLLSRMPSSA